MYQVMQQVEPKAGYNLRIKVCNEMLAHLINPFVGWEMNGRGSGLTEWAINRSLKPFNYGNTVKERIT